MFQKLHIYLTPSRASVEVQATVSRETAAPNLAAVIDNMPEDDLEILLRFCDSVSAFARRSDRSHINALIPVRR